MDGPLLISQLPENKLLNPFNLKNISRAAQLGVAVDAPPALPLPGGQPHHRHHERLLRRAREARGARHLAD